MPITNSFADLEHVNFELCQITETHATLATVGEFYLKIELSPYHDLERIPSPQSYFNNVIEIEIVTKDNDNSNGSIHNIYIGSVDLPPVNGTIDFLIDFYEFPSNEIVPQGLLSQYFSGHPEIQLAVKKRKKITYTRVQKKNLLAQLLNKLRNIFGRKK